MSSIHARIEQLVAAKGTSLYQLSKDLGHKRPDKFYSIVNGKAKPSFDTIDEILTRYPDVNANWLLRGEGEMWLSTQPAVPAKRTSDKTQGFDFSRLNQMKTQVVVAVVDQDDNPAIPMVDTRAAAGYVDHYTEPEYFKKLPTFTLPGAEFHNGTFCCFQVHGESMTDTLFPGDWLITRFEDNWISSMREGGVYVVVTDENVLVKRVLNRINERGKLILISDNPVFPTQDVTVEQVRQMWYVQARLSFQLPDTPGKPNERIHHLEADMQEMRERLSVLELKAHHYTDSERRTA